MRRIISFVIIVWYAALASAAAGESSTFVESIREGKVNLGFRLRYETVDQDGIANKAHAPTLRTQLLFQSERLHGVSFLLEAENVTAVGDDDEFANAGAGSLNNGVTGYPVVADPGFTELNQVDLSWIRGDNELHLGRREVLIGNQRFVGNVGWRQNHQSFDSISFQRKGDRFGFGYYYLDDVHRIFGDSKAMSSHVATLRWAIASTLNLDIYGLFLDYDNPSDVGLSTRTVGARVSSRETLGSARVGFAVEYAQQEDWGDNPNAIDADYSLAEISLGPAAIRVTAGLEVLGGKLGRGRFSTPLATLHKFNGWADKFLATPAAGLEDLYLTVGGGGGAWKWLLGYHDFRADEGSADYGSEVDGLVTVKLKSGCSLGAKTALYEAESHATDTTKAMVWTACRFGK